jgi:hypothetical protein
VATQRLDEQRLQEPSDHRPRARPWPLDLREERLEKWREGRGNDASAGARLDQVGKTVEERMSVRRVERHASRDDLGRFSLVPRDQRATDPTVDDQDLAPVEPVGPEGRVDRDVTHTRDRHMDGNSLQGKLARPRALAIRRRERGTAEPEFLERLGQRVLV